MENPRIGVGVPNFGPNASPDAIVAVAQRAEQLGFDSAWTFERLLIPAANAYGLPEGTASIYDPLETSTWVAAHTQRIRLGCCVLNALFRPPVILARQLATIDHFSGGRLLAGIGQGWMPEEFQVANVPLSRRGRGFEEYIAALRACWAADPVEFEGRHYTIPPSNIGPKPLHGSVPLLIGGVSEAAIQRAARLGNGFAAVFQNWEALGEQMRCYREAGGAGIVVLRVNPEKVLIDDSPLPFTGSAAAVRADFAQAASLGIDELIWDLNFAGLEPPRQIKALETLAATMKR